MHKKGRVTQLWRGLMFMQEKLHSYFHYSRALTADEDAAFGILNAYALEVVVFNRSVVVAFHDILNCEQSVVVAEDALTLTLFAAALATASDYQWINNF